MSFPLKEGLRQYFVVHESELETCRNVFSIKRRIATRYVEKTRGKLEPVEMSFPLKEGLRLSFVCYFLHSFIFVEMSFPLKEGLRHAKLKPRAINLYVEMSFPLKEGLRHNGFD